MAAADHELLNLAEFKSRLMPLGCHDRALGKLFSTLVRHTLWSSDLRSAGDIGYYEINRQGNAELALSVPNLADNLDALEAIYGISTRSVEICRLLVESSSSANPAGT